MDRLNITSTKRAPSVPAGARTADLTVVGGAGHVGIPLLLALAPVDEFLNPVQAEIQRCIDGLLPPVSDERLLILRSTVYPGTTDWLQDCLNWLGRKNGLAFCPERVVQGTA